MKNALNDDSSENAMGKKNGVRIELGSIKEFFIDIDDPHKAFYPGDEICGQIILVSNKNLANIAVTLSLVGYVKLKTNSHSKLRPTKSVLFNHSIKIYGDDTQLQENVGELTNGLSKGEHRFPFIVKLPRKKVFTSIDFGRGCIRYSLKATIADQYTTLSSRNGDVFSLNDNTGSRNNIFLKTKNLRIKDPTCTSEKFINLISPIDVSKLPPPKPKRIIIRDPRSSKRLSRTQSSTSTNTSNTIGTLSTTGSDSNTMEQGSSNCNGQVGSPSTTPGTNEESKLSVIKVSLEIPERGYLRGELIPIKLHINHLRAIKDIKGIIVTFVRVCRLDNGPENEFESFRKDLQQVILPLYVDPKTFQSEISTTLRVPADAFPTISGCPLVSFQYFIEVLINLSGKPMILDGNDHKKQQNTFLDDNNCTFMETGSSDSKYKLVFHSNISVDNQQRTEFINTDKYKRMKKFIQLTSEVIIGTTRKAKLESSEGSPGESGDSHPPSESRWQSSSTNIRLPSESRNNTPNLPASLPQNETIQPQVSRELSFMAPPYVEDINHYPEIPAPIYQDASGNMASLEAGSISIPDFSHLSEKEQLRTREAGLFPSEPNFDDLDDDGETISPIDNILSMSDQPTPEASSGGEVERILETDQSTNENSSRELDDDRQSFSSTDKEKDNEQSD